MIPDLAEPVRAALVADAAITAELAAYRGSFPIFTRAPVPDDAPYPLVVLGAQLQVGEEDGISDERPVVTCDIAAYGQNDTAAKFRAVDRIGRAVHALFNRRRGAITISGWGVTSITASGPAPAPVDDEQTVGRRVTVTFRLARSY